METLQPSGAEVVTTPAESPARHFLKGVGERALKLAHVPWSDVFMDEQPAVIQPPNPDASSTWYSTSWQRF